MGENEGEITELSGTGSRVLGLGWAKVACGKEKCIASKEPSCTVWSGWLAKLTWRGLTLVGRFCCSCCSCCSCEVEVGFCCISAKCPMVKEEVSEGEV